MKIQNRKFSYRNIEFHHLHHGGSFTYVLELVYTKYEVNRSIIKGCVPIQPDNLVFSTLTNVTEEESVNRFKSPVIQEVAISCA